MHVVNVDNLTVRYDQTLALDKVSFTIEDKEFIGIIGPNGGGKTTLVKTLLGLLTPSEGGVTVAAGERIGYVPQYVTFDRQFPISVMDVILTAHLPKKFKLGHRFKGHDEEHALKVMTQLGIKDLARRQIGQLSGGQLQRVLIARALMNHPTVLILDEPTANVDQEAKNTIYDLLKNLNQDMTIVIISHDTSQIMPYLDRYIYIDQAAHLCENPKNPLERADCPVDWFIEGERIHKVLVDGQEERD